MNDITMNVELFDKWYDRKYSINNHSLRVYRVVFDYVDYKNKKKQEEHFYMLDRVTDTLPPYFSLYEFMADLVPFAIPDTYYNERLISNKDHGFLDIKWEREIQVDGKSNWGDGLSWNAAEKKFKQRILELWDEED